MSVCVSVPQNFYHHLKGNTSSLSPHSLLRSCRRDRKYQYCVLFSETKFVLIASWTRDGIYSSNEQHRFLDNRVSFPLPQKSFCCHSFKREKLATSYLSFFGPIFLLFHSVFWTGYLLTLDWTIMNQFMASNMHLQTNVIGSDSKIGLQRWGRRPSHHDICWRSTLAVPLLALLALAGAWL